MHGCRTSAWHCRTCFELHLRASPLERVRSWVLYLEGAVSATCPDFGGSCSQDAFGRRSYRLLTRNLIRNRNRSLRPRSSLAVGQEACCCSRRRSEQDVRHRRGFRRMQMYLHLHLHVDRNRDRDRGLRWWMLLRSDEVGPMPHKGCWRRSGSCAKDQGARTCWRCATSAEPMPL